MTAVARDRIDSPKNPRIRALVRLHDRRERTRTGRALVEGAREARRALDAGVHLDAVYVATDLLGAEGRELLAALRAERATIVETSSSAFERASRRQGPDGVLAVIVPPRHDLETLSLPDRPLVLVAVDTEKPGNLGALIRSADAAGVDAVLAVGGAGTDPWNPGVIRTSMGSVFALPVLATDAGRARAWLAHRRLAVLATSPGAELDFWDADLAGATAIVVGPEHEGLDASWTDPPSATVRVPMGGAADSLNASVTGALLLFEAVRQRRAAGVHTPAARARP